MQATRALTLSTLTLSLMACGGGNTVPDNPASQASEQASAKVAGSGLQANSVLSLQVTTPGYTNRYVRHAGGLGFTEVVNAGSTSDLKKDASWKAVPGLADPACYSFQSVNVPNDFLRHSSSRIIKSTNDNGALFKSDATWCAVDGLSGTGVSFQSKNYPGRYLRHYAGQLWMSQRGGPLPSDGAGSFNEDVTWNIAAAWSGGGCTGGDWVRGVNYSLGTVVRFTDGKFYKVVNVGTNGSDGTDPTVSTWYWQPAACEAPSPAPAPAPSDLNEPRNKDIAMQLVSSAENSSLDWRAQYQYIEDIGDGRGYTAGIIGFCSGTGDMLELVEAYTRSSPNNVLAKYLSALRRVDGTASHSGLDPNYTGDWRKAAADAVFKSAQDSERDRVYFNPAVNQAKADGLRALGQFAYYDAIVMHGPGNSSVSFGGIRAAALAKAKPPSQGGNETTYLNAFLDARVAAMKTEAAHEDTSRVDTAQRVFLRAGNLDLKTPLAWKVYGESFSIK